MILFQLFDSNLKIENRYSYKLNYTFNSDLLNGMILSIFYLKLFYSNNEERGLEEIGIIIFSYSILI